MDRQPKHTPGPWHVGINPGPMVYDEHGEQIADCRAVGYDNGGNMANAALIAAAPDLLEACKTAENWLGEYETGPDSGLHGLLEQLRAAIAKASGGAA